MHHPCIARIAHRSQRAQQAFSALDYRPGQPVTTTLYDYDYHYRILRHVKLPAHGHP